MPVMDEFKEERAAMKKGTPRQKLAYFWDYYKWHFIGGCALILAVISFVYQAATRKETALYVLLLNGLMQDRLAEESEATAAFAEYAGIDETEYEIIYDTSLQFGTDNDYAAAQKLMVSVAAQELDVVVSDADSLTTYAYQEYFYDLRNFLSPEQLALCQDSFYYMDAALVPKIDAAIEEGRFDYTPEYGDPRHPEDMQDPIPVGIYLAEDSPLLAQYAFRDSDPAVCVLTNTTRPEQAAQFVAFLMQ